MRRTYKYRIYPTGEAEINARRWLWKLWHFYCIALSQRIVMYKLNGETISNYDQYKTMVSKRNPPEGMEWLGLDEIPARVMQFPLKDLHEAYQHFFRRVKNGEKPGFPRFPRFRDRNSITLDLTNGKPTGWEFDDNYFTIKGIGKFKVKYHRKIQGNIKTVTLIREGKEWYVCLSCVDVPNEILPKTGHKIAIYMERPWYGCDSVGVCIREPAFYRKDEENIVKRQRRVSRRIKGSNRRRKARMLLTDYHRHISRKRKDYIHNLAWSYVKKYDTIVLNKLYLKEQLEYQEGERKVKDEREKRKEITDNSWGYFVQYLQHKGEKYGREIIVEKMEDEGGSHLENAKKLLACAGPTQRKSYRKKRLRRELHLSVETTSE